MGAMERPDKLSLKDAVAEANRGTLKQRVARHRARLRRKYQAQKLKNLRETEKQD